MNSHESFFKRFIFREGREREREGEKHQCVVASHVPLTGDLACNPGMCPDWESNQLPFDLQAGTQPLSHTSQGVNLQTILRLKDFPGTFRTFSAESGAILAKPNGWSPSSDRGEHKLES